MPVTVWDNPHIEELKQHVADGLSFSKCAQLINEKFGTAYSRNACIGKALRLGLHTCSAIARAAAGKTTNAVQKIKRQRRPRGPATGYVNRTFDAAPQTERERTGLAKIGFRPSTGFKMNPPTGAAPDPSPLRCVEVEPLKIALADLEPHHCRWPIGGWPADTPITFCGLHKFQGSYCEAHCDLNTRRVYDTSNREAA